MGKEDGTKIDTLSALNITRSLFLVKRGIRRPELRQAYKSGAMTLVEMPTNVEEDVLDAFIQIVSERRVSVRDFKLDEPYWISGTKYDPLEIYATAIQFSDDHKEPLALTTLPPSEDIRQYGNLIFKSDRRSTLPEQFKKLLDITGNNVVGAANLGFVASRVYARGGDTRAYPDIPVGVEDIHCWNRRVANFETYGNLAKNDAAGDTYYFWTHFFTASVYASLKTQEANILSNVFSKGTEIMRFIRGSIVGQPTISEHREASIIGRNVGLAVIDFIGQS